MTKIENKIKQAPNQEATSYFIAPEHIYIGNGNLNNRVILSDVHSK